LFDNGTAEENDASAVDWTDLEYTTMKRGFPLTFPQVVLLIAAIIVVIWIWSGNSPLTQHTPPAAEQSDTRA
jgi:hypothetical protein